MRAALQQLRTDLVDRRMWPVVALLVLALVAVPHALNRSPAAPAGAAPVTRSPAARGPGAPARPGGDRRVEAAGPMRDPFAAGAQPEAARRVATTRRPAARPTAPSPAPSPSAGTPQSSPATPEPSVSAPATAARRTPGGPPARASHGAAPVHRLRRVDLRFGTAIVPPLRRDIVRLTALPSGRTPAVVFLGVTADGRRAVFSLLAGTTVSGDGRCVPRVRACAQLLLAAGQGEVVQAGGVPYRLAVLRIRTETTRSAARARAFARRVSPKGSCVLALQQPFVLDDAGLRLLIDTDRCRYVLGPGEAGGVT